MKKLLSILHHAFHNPNATSYRILTPIIWLLIFVSIFLFVIDISIDEQHSSRKLLEWIDTGVLIFFGFEYLARIISYQAPRFALFNHSRASLLRQHVIERVKYALHPLNLIDLLTILGGTPELRGLRALRLLRLLRLLRGSTIFQYSNPLHEIFDSLQKNRLLYMLSFSIVGFSTLVGGLSIFLVEDSITTIADGFWWAIVTLTTVGYGDISPVSLFGRLVASALMIVGMFTLALFAGVVSQTLLQSVMSIREEQFRMSTHMNHIVICNYEPSARMLLDTLLQEYDLSDKKAVIFTDFERTSDIPSEFEWQRGDPTKESELSKVRIEYAEACIVVGSRSALPQIADAKTILTIFTIRAFMEKAPENKARKKKLYIAAEILDSENIVHAKTAGASEVIESTKVGFSLLSHAISHQGSASVLSKIANFEDQNLFIGTPPSFIKLPTSFQELHATLHEMLGLMVIGIQEDDEYINPDPKREVTQKSGIIYLSEEPKLEPFHKKG